MGLLGTLILLFLIVHLAHFWVPSRFTGLDEVMIDGKPHHNLFILMVEVFKSPIVVIIYVLGVLSLAYHLLHGFQSAFQTFGWRNGKYKAIFISIGFFLSIFIPLVFASMPIVMHLGWIQ
jgi:succinate dehydrogenase / fumarate reductase cytochrome b subunit